MVLAMVIISGPVGGGALGFEAVSAVRRSDLGIGFAFVAILDRST
jgi:ABC-type proline/glycine betaine transport system permease subunit